MHGMSRYTIKKASKDAFDLYTLNDFTAWEQECKPGLWQRFRSSDFCKGMLMFWGYT